MGYKKYKHIQQLKDKFGVAIHRRALLDTIEPVEPSNWLLQTLQWANHTALSNEKVKSERIISPILTEVHNRYQQSISLFSGEELNIQPENNLNGACDFFFCASPDAYLLEAPIIALAEAKNEDMDYGIAQCSAQMIAAQLFNRREERAIEHIWGCATTAHEWRFLQLHDNQLYIDSETYFLQPIATLLGAFAQIIQNSASAFR